MQIGFQCSSAGRDEPLPMLLVIYEPFLVSSLRTYTSIDPDDMSLERIVKIATFVVSYIDAQMDLVRRSVSFSSDSLLVSFGTEVHEYSLQAIVSLAQASVLAIPHSLLGNVYGLSPKQRLTEESREHKSAQFD